jgi:hypothetical protein
LSGRLSGSGRGGQDNEQRAGETRRETFHHSYISPLKRHTIWDVAIFREYSKRWDDVQYNRA